MAQQSVRRDRKNQYLLSCLEHVCLIWIRSANSHTGQQRKLRKQAGQMAASDQRQYSKSPLAIRGASTEEQMHLPLGLAV